jgi:hypothetical protein
MNPQKGLKKEERCDALVNSRPLEAYRNYMTSSINFPMQHEHILMGGNTTIGVMPALGLVSHFQVDSWQVLYRPTKTGNVARWGLPP